jgi:FkbM family methyltransferase
VPSSVRFCDSRFRSSLLHALRFFPVADFWRHPPLLQQLIRLPLKCVPKSLVVPILSGRARGLKWITGSGTHGCWLGTYERDRQQRLQEVLKPGTCFLDIGANVGFYSVLASCIVGELGQVHSFEPSPRNVSFLTRHIELNRLSNVHIHAVALSDGPDRQMSFAASANPCSGHLTANHGAVDCIPVRVTSLDSLWRRSAYAAPSVIKIDVEGAELNVLQGGRQLLAECRPVILLAGHSTAIQEQCCRYLREIGYRVDIDRDGSHDGMYESTGWPDARLGSAVI